MRFVRCIEDAKGDLVELVYYCSAFCYEVETDPELQDRPGGAWPCLDASLVGSEHCTACGRPMGTRCREFFS